MCDQPRMMRFAICHDEASCCSSLSASIITDIAPDNKDDGEDSQSGFVIIPGVSNPIPDKYKAYFLVI